MTGEMEGRGIKVVLKLEGAVNVLEEVEIILDGAETGASIISYRF